MDKLQKVSFAQFREMLGPDGARGDNKDFLIVDLKYEKALNFMRYPFRFVGYLVVFCTGGSLRLDINLRSYSIRQNSMAIIVPGYILRVSEVDPASLDDLGFVVLALSHDFASNVRFDFVRLFNESMRILDNPIFTLRGEDLKIAEDYHRLAQRIVASQATNKREALVPLLASFCYSMGSAWEKQLDGADPMPCGKNATRLKLVFEHFLRLVSEYHDRERNVSFYADHMGFTPKYLSKLIKEVSGRSAPEWIDSFVILEAKNMLKYSDCTIKEIVFRLNFPNQSVFYKYFKAHTGMTPSEYRAS